MSSKGSKKKGKEVEVPPFGPKGSNVMVKAIQAAERASDKEETPEDALLASGEEAMDTYLSGLVSPRAREKVMKNIAKAAGEESDESDDEFETDEEDTEAKAPEPKGDKKSANPEAMEVVRPNVSLEEQIGVEKKGGGASSSSGSQNKDLAARQAAAHERFKKLKEEKRSKA